MLKAYLKFLNGIEKIVNAAVVFLLFFAFVIIFAQVVVRYIFHSGYPWMEESARFMIIWMSFLASTVAIRHRKHMFIDIFESMLPEKGRMALNVFFDILMIAFFAIMVVLGYQYTVQNQSNFSSGLNISMVYVYTSLIAGMFLMTLYTIECLWKRLATGRAHPDDETDQEPNTSL